MAKRGIQRGHPRYGQPPSKGTLARITPAHAPRIERISRIYVERPEIPNKDLAKELGVSEPVLTRTLQVMIRHRPEAYKERAHWGRPTRVRLPDGRIETRRLRIKEIEAMREEVRQAILTGKSLGLVKLKYPGLTAARIYQITYVLRGRGELPAETKLRGKSGRPQTVTQIQLGIVANALLSGVTDNEAIRQRLNRRVYKIGSREVRYPAKSVENIRSLWRALRARVKAAYAEAVRTSEFTPISDLAEFLDLELMKPYTLAEHFGFKRPD